MESPTPVIECHGLTVRFGRRQILHDLEASLSGRMIGLLGPNGAGKSTLIHTLLGFCPIARGQARVLGHTVPRDLRRLREQVGYMPENDAFVADMTAVALLRQLAELSGLPSRVALERAHEALFYVGLGEARYRRLGTLSLGMRQMVKLAQALVHGPRLLILDEPTNGLDPSARDRMIHVLKNIRDSGQATLLLCSHLLRDVEQTCDTVMILKEGRVVRVVDLVAERNAHVRYVELETTAEDGRLAAALPSLSVDSQRVRPGLFRLTLSEQQSLRDLFVLAQRLDVPLRRLSYRRDSLESIFLKAMES